MKIAIASDHRGVQERVFLKNQLEADGHEIIDLGAFTEESCDYPDLAAEVCKRVASGDCDYGILICGTGIGMSIAANKFRGIRAAACHDEFTTECSRRHNHANVLCFGADVVPARRMVQLARLWLSTGEEGGRHARRVAKIAEIEKWQQAR